MRADGVRENNLNDSLVTISLMWRCIDRIGFWTGSNTAADPIIMTTNNELKEKNIDKPVAWLSIEQDKWM